MQCHAQCARLRDAEGVGGGKREALAPGGWHVLADAAAQALLALTPDAVMLAYLRPPAFLAPALAAVMLAYA